MSFITTRLIRVGLSVIASLGIATASPAADPTPAKHPVPESPLWLTFPAKAGITAPKHIVLIAADQEYRSECALPMLAKLLAERHGFHCTVLFSLNENDEVDPTKKIRYDDKKAIHKVPGFEHLVEADLVILFSRLISLPENDLKQITKYLDSGKPIIGIRTANHGLLDFDYRVKNKRMDLGDDVFGGAFRSHHGNWQQDSTRGIIVEKNKDHPILIGVQDIWALTDVYRTFNEGRSLPAGCTSLVDGQPLMGRKQTDKINTKLIALPVAWVKTWVGNGGKEARVFNTTMGSAEDFENEGLRRLMVNATYWCLGLEKQIDPKSSVEYVGEYKPLKSGFDYPKLKVVPHKPSYYK